MINSFIIYLIIQKEFILKCLLVQDAIFLGDFMLLRVSILVSEEGIAIAKYIKKTTIKQ